MSLVLFTKFLKIRIKNKFSLNFLYLHLIKTNNMVRNKLKKILLASTFVVGGALAGNQIQGQTVNDTIWGNGFFHVEQEGGPSLVNKNIYCTPLQMQGDTIPDTTYTFITDNFGETPFNLPVLIDLATLQKEQKNKSIDALVAPNPSNDFNFAFYGKPTSDLKIINMQGQIVQNVKIEYDEARNISTAYVDLSKEAKGTYAFGTTTKDGKVGGTIITTPNQSQKAGKRKLTPPVNNNTNTKSTNMYSAVYDINITHEGCYDFNEQITIQDGNNGLITLILEELPGIPQYQFIGGKVVDEDDNPIEGATVRIREQGTNIVLDELVTQPDGTYQFADSLLPGTQFYFGVGDVEGKSGFEGDQAEVPIQITNLADTLKTVYKFILYDKDRQVPGEDPGVTVQPTADQIAEFGPGSQAELSVRDSILWNQSTYAWTENQKEVNRNTLENGMNLFGVQGMYSEVDYELNDVNLLEYNAYTNPFIGLIGVNVAPGTDNTSPYILNVITPLGNSFSTSLGAEMTISGVETSFYKEFFGKVLYLNNISSRPSFMNLTATMPNHLDRAIVNLIVNHYKKVFDENEPKAYFGLENIKDEIFSSKAPLKQDALPSTSYVSKGSF